MEASVISLKTIRYPPFCWCGGWKGGGKERNILLYALPIRQLYNGRRRAENVRCTVQYSRQMTEISLSFTRKEYSDLFKNKTDSAGLVRFRDKPLRKEMSKDHPLV